MFSEGLERDQWHELKKNNFLIEINQLRSLFLRMLAIIFNSLSLKK